MDREEEEKGEGADSGLNNPWLVAKTRNVLIKNNTCDHTW